MNRTDEAARYDALERRIKWLDLNSKRFNQTVKGRPGKTHYGILIVRRRGRIRFPVGVLSYCGQGGTIVLGPDQNKVTCKPCMKALAAEQSSA